MISKPPGAFTASPQDEEATARCDPDEFQLSIIVSCGISYVIDILIVLAVDSLNGPKSVLVLSRSLDKLTCSALGITEFICASSPIGKSAYAFCFLVGFLSRRVEQQIGRRVEVSLPSLVDSGPRNRVRHPRSSRSRYLSSESVDLAASNALLFPPWRPQRGLPSIGVRF